MGAADEMRSGTERAWRELRVALTDADLEAATSAGWSVKEMVAHVAFWLETVPPFVTGAFRGDPSGFQVTFPSGYVPDEDGGWPSADVHNAREAAWARPQPAEVVLDRADQAYAQVRRFLDTVTDEEVAAQAGYYAEIGGHLDAHRLGELAT